MTHKQDDLSKEKIQFRLTYIAKTLSGNGIVPRNNHTVNVDRLEDNRNYWRGFLDGDGKGRRQ